MTDHARRSDEPDEPRLPTPRQDPLGLEAYLERQHAEFEGGPTMAEILEDMDRYRRPVTPGGETVAESLEATRCEREQQQDER